MKLRHKTPCDECPWRRKHPAGWLGGYKPEDFTAQVQFDGPPVPCHKTIPPGLAPDADDDRISICAGSLIFMKNQCKSAQHSDYPERVLDEVEKNTDDFFQWTSEFLEHHNDPESWFNKARAKG